MSRTARHAAFRRVAVPVAFHSCSECPVIANTRSHLPKVQYLRGLGVCRTVSSWVFYVNFGTAICHSETFLVSLLLSFSFHSVLSRSEILVVNWGRRGREQLLFLTHARPHTRPSLSRERRGGTSTPSISLFS